ncbi:MAG: ATP-binding protein [Pseudonocardia sp.]
MARGRERALLGGVLGFAGAAAVFAALRGVSGSVPVLVTVGAVALATSAHLLRRDAEQARHGLLLHAAAVCLVLSNADAVLDPPAALIGLVTLWWSVPLIGVVLFTYPGPRVVRRWHRWLLVAVWSHFIVLWPAAVLLPDLGSMAGEVLGGVLGAGAVALPALACVGLVQRWRGAAAPERRAVRSVAVVGLALAGTFCVRILARVLADTGPLMAAVHQVTTTANLACLGLAPVGLLLEALRRRAARAGMIEDLLVAGADPARIRTAMARALEDPTVLLQAAGTPPGEGAGRVRRELRSGTGSVLAVAEADEATTRDPAQLRVVLACAALALDNARLQADLLCTLAEVRASRERIVAATVRSRRRLERDLHDGAQQQLLAVAATLARAELVADGAGRACAVREARDQLAGALDELRRLARGIHPAVLTQGGLAAALPTLGDAAPVPVDVEAPAGARFPAAVESTLWFVAAEAVTNAVRHGAAGAIRITLRAATGSATVAVTDDGRGGARATPGGGLTGLADRVGALGGTFSVVSPLGRGTSVEAVLPCAS